MTSHLSESHFSNPPKSIAIVGGGPGVLYFAILTKKALPDC
jgi:anthraniloyl-CoA monooxygenase